MRIELKATVLALAAATCVLGATFGFALVLQSAPGPASKPVPQPSSGPVKPVAASDTTAEQGHRLFDRNCAHCHGDDARGDEGPTLYNLALSDARIAKRIREGIKGEMPKFGSKFNDADIQALIAYLRTLKD
jgi:mono/diheme cytochrome c family protein